MLIIQNGTNISLDKSFLFSIHQSIGTKDSTSASVMTAERSSGMLDFSEVRGDLFSCPPSSSLAHCVSEDMAMGKGIAVLFKKELVN